MVKATIVCDDINPLWQSGSTPALNDEVHVWEIKVPENKAVIEQLRQILNAEEREKALAFHHLKDSWNFITRKSALRILLGRYLSVSPATIEFTPGRNKKPQLNYPSGKHIRFNSSHSGVRILLAFAGFEVGVDVEEIKPNFPYDELLDECFSDKEIECIRSSGQPERDFFRFWTRKESLIKGTAKGIDDDLLKIPALDGTHHVSFSILESSVNWKIRSFYMDNHYQGCVAYPAGSSAVRFTSFSLEDHLDKHPY